MIGPDPFLLSLMADVRTLDDWTGHRIQAHLRQSCR